MTELLVTVAILAVLAAIAVPSAVTIQRDLKVLELNDTAREIFIAAQNQLTALRASGGKNALPGAPGQEILLNNEDGSPVKGLFYVSEEDGQFSEMLPYGAIDTTLFDGAKTAVIEYNPQSSSVYAVFYAETAFTYDPENMPRDDEAGKTARRDLPLGYYGGAAAGIPTIDVIAQPEITLENGEELALNIDHTDAAAEAQKENPQYETQVIDQLRYTIEIQQDDKKENKLIITTSSTDAGTPIQFEGGRHIKGKLVLDSLTDKHFATLVQQTEGFAIDPGADIIVTVTIDYTDGDSRQSMPVIWESQVENSLFHARGQDKDTKQEVTEVSCGRHLQNLEDRISGVSTDAASAYSVKHVRQSARIDWLKNYSGKQVTEYKLGDIGAGGTTAQKKFAQNAFVSITNPTIQSFTGSAAGIHNLWINENDDEKFGGGGKNGKATGLFGGLVGENASERILLKDIMLVNPYAECASTGTGMFSSVGTLAGYTENVTLENCRAYLDKAGLEQWKSGKRTYGAKVPDQEVMPYAGGLVGRAQATALKQCFAALTAVTSSAYNGGITGGLIGQVNENTDITECYADTLSLKGANVGGLVGEALGAVITDCYAVGQIQLDGWTNPAGFSASFTNSTAKNCYAAVTINSQSEDNRKKLKGFVEAPYKTVTGCYYAVDTIGGPLYPEKAEPSQPQPITYKELKNWAAFGDKGLWNLSDAETTCGYSMKEYADLGALQPLVEETLYEHDVYPFPRLAAFNHYGDWPLPAKTGALVYYEVYGDGSIGLEGYWPDGKPFETEHKLQDGAAVVVRDGYAYAGRARQATLGFGGTGTVQVKAEEALTALAGIKDTFLCPLTYSDLKSDLLAAQTYYRQVTVNGMKTDLYFNPHFARTVVHGADAGKRPVPSEPVQIRSARQLAALGLFWERDRLNQPVYQGEHSLPFEQGLAIDFTRYDSNYASDLRAVPIGGKDMPFDASYDGQYRTIWANGIEETGDTVGLFRYNAGTLTNIVFRGKGENPSVSGKTHVGALAGYSSGVVTNCAVSGFTVTGEFAGGLIGAAASKLTNCSAACTRVSGQYAGGLAGQFSGPEINNCYTVGDVAGKFVSAGIVARPDFDQLEEIDNCYSACTINENGSKFAIAPLAATLVNCWYLKDTMPLASPMEKATGISYAELETLSALAGFGPAAATYPDTMAGQTYPFPTIIKNDRGFVHYGDWPAKPEEPEQTFVIGVAINAGTDKETGKTKYDIWGVGEDGRFGKFEQVETKKNPSEPPSVLICIPKQGHGAVDDDWYVWNESLEGKGLRLKDMKGYNEISGSTYQFYLSDDTRDWGLMNFFYDSQPGSGSPPAGYQFFISTSEGQDPVYQKNEK